MNYDIIIREHKEDGKEISRVKDAEWFDLINYEDYGHNGTDELLDMFNKLQDDTAEETFGKKVKDLKPKCPSCGSYNIEIENDVNAGLCHDCHTTFQPYHGEVMDDELEVNESLI